MNGISRTKKYQVFVSYADADAEWVNGFLLPACKSSGLTYITETAFELGTPRLEAFENAIKESEVTLLIITPAYMLGDYVRFVELLGVEHGLETGTWPVIPLYLKPVQELPLRLRQLKGIDATEQSLWEPTAKRLADRFNQPTPQVTPVPPPPYPGLLSFCEDQTHIFCGRAREAEDLINLLNTYPFLALIGPSASGKSSLVHAGLIPKLQNNNLFGPGGWQVYTLRPGEDPMRELRLVLGGSPNRSNETITDLLAVHRDGKHVFIFVDQFEELFTIAKEDTRPFQEALLSLMRLPDTFLVLAIRADFYGELMVLSFWNEIRDNHYDLLPLGEKELAMAIWEPAEKVEVYVEAALVERLVADAGREPGILPFVQETMRLLWNKIQRRYLPFAAYDTLILPRSEYEAKEDHNITGLKAAIGIHANGVYSRLSEDQRAIARRIFVRLVQFGEGRAHTRRQQPVSRLCGSTDPVLFNQVVAYLAGDTSRLLVLSGNEQELINVTVGTTSGGHSDQKSEDSSRRQALDRRVDIAHEALIDAWPAFKKWLAKGRDGELLRRRMADDTDQWVDKSHETSFLYTGAKLLAAEEWRKENPDELSQSQLQFLEASKKHDLRRRQLRLFAQVTVILFAVIGFLAIGYGIRQLVLNLSARGPMVHFEAGQAILGSDTFPASESFPQREVGLAGFWIDQFEVINRQYLACMRAGACTTPSSPKGEPAVEDAEEDLPVVYVNAYQAYSFCRWIGRRLPTAAEWERAARGTEGRIWPWGNDELTPQRANLMFDRGFGDTAPAFSEPPGPVFPTLPEVPPLLTPEVPGVAPDQGSPAGEVPHCLVSVRDDRFSSGSTPEGIMHMLGNAFEWTSTPADECPDPYQCSKPWDGQTRVTALYWRGLSCMTPIMPDDLVPDDPALLTESVSSAPNVFDPFVGFRCAK